MSDAARLAAELGPWRAVPGPRYAALAAAIAAALEHGAFDGATLPAERRLAAQLGVSRSTVTRAYAELRRAGVLASRERSGTVVRPVALKRRAPAAQLPQLTHLLAPDDGGIDLSVAAPPLDDELRELTVSLADAAGALPPHGYVPGGLWALREAIAAYETAAGVPTAPDEVLVTTGAHEALHLLASVLVGRRQVVVCETPTYPGALESFERAGARAVGVGEDVAGMRPDALRDTLARTFAGFVYLMPGCRNPTGTALPEGRRRALVAIAEEHDVLLVEDAALDEVRFTGPLPPLRALAPERVLRVGSLSKIAWAGLRVGWIAGPRALVGRLARVKGARDLGGGVLGQLAALELLRRAERLFPRRRATARARVERLAAELRARLPDWDVPLPDGGWSLWARLPGVDGDALVAAAAAAGVHVAPGRAHFADGRAVEAVRVCAGASPDRFAEGAARLARAWAALRYPPEPGSLGAPPIASRS